MHLHGPYICQHGILLNCPPFSDSECDSIIKHAHSEFARINSVKKTIKSRYIKLVVSADKKDKTLEEAAVSVIPQSRGHFTSLKTAKFSDGSNCILMEGSLVDCMQ